MERHSAEEVAPVSPATLIFDGDCHLCRRCAAWIRPRLPAEVVTLPYQQADLAALGISSTEALGAAIWLDPSGRQQRGHRAVAASLCACGGGWNALGRVLRWPVISQLAAGAYEVVARNRHRLGCRNCVRRAKRGGPALS